MATAEERREGLDILLRTLIAATRYSTPCTVLRTVQYAPDTSKEET
jgi:hypothetical protein